MSAALSSSKPQAYDELTFHDKIVSASNVYSIETESVKVETDDLASKFVQIVDTVYDLQV